MKINVCAKFYCSIVWLSVLNHLLIYNGIFETIIYRKVYLEICL